MALALIGDGYTLCWLGACSPHAGRGACAGTSVAVRRTRVLCISTWATRRLCGAQALFAQAVSQFGRVDAVQLTGRGNPPGEFTGELRPSSGGRLVGRQPQRHVFLHATGVSRDARRTQGGRIFNGSIWPAPLRSIAYTATKHAVMGLSPETSALDGRKHNIAVGQDRYWQRFDRPGLAHGQGVPQANGEIAGGASRRGHWVLSRCATWPVCRWEAMCFSRDGDQDAFCIQGAAEAA